jgi:hypothetical protein
MQAPKLPSFFKRTQHRRFDLKTRYYDEQQEDLKLRVERAESGRSNLRMQNSWGPAKRAAEQRTSNRTVILLIIALLLISVLIIKY